MQTGKNVAIAFPLAVPHLALFMRGVTDYARANASWTFTVSPTIVGPFPETLAMPLRCLRDWPGDGVIGVITNDQDAEDAANLRIPVVNLAAATRVSRQPRVTVDHRAIGQMAAEHLLDCGLRRFVYLGIKDVWYSELRRDGFAERIAEAGGLLQVYETPLRNNPNSSWQSGLEEIRHCLENIFPPVGIFAVHDYRARLLVDECFRMGFAVPNDVAILGVDNDEIVCEFCQPSLSSVSRNGYQVGYEAAALLDRLMDGQKPPNHDLWIPPDGVVKRESTDLIAVHDPHVATAVRFIQDHIEEPFGVEKLLQLLPVSRRRFENLFKEYLGRTPYEYLCHVRVKRAKEILAGTEHLGIGEVARRSGFPNSQRFRLVFTRLVGKTPTAYRRDLPPTR
ncbi:MAG: substrate-binding domain-containing protein [Pirellulaceae bacterium]|nr:substrate-binding domain-containing protein [Pirellulaceae bacterium]